MFIRHGHSVQLGWQPHIAWTLAGPVEQGNLPAHSWVGRFFIRGIVAQGTDSAGMTFMPFFKAVKDGAGKSVDEVWRGLPHGLLPSGRQKNINRIMAS